MRETTPDRLRERGATEADTGQRGEALLAVAETGPNHLLRRRHAGRGPVRVGASQAGVGITDPAFRLRTDIRIRAVGGHVHGAVVRRRDEHRIAVEPGVGHGVHDQLRLPRAGRTGNDGQRFAPEPVEG